MNEYVIYWIKKEIAYHFFHKNDILYRFLVAYTNNLHDQQLARQYEYITKKFPYWELLSHIKKYADDHTISIEHIGQAIELYKDDHYIALRIDNKKITIYCYTLHCAEKIIFPMLRLFHPLLFIMSNNVQKFGWISPFVKSEQINKKEILYSLR